MKLSSLTPLMAALILLTTLLNARIALAEVAVIVNPANDSNITSDDISKLYLGKTKKFPNGKNAVALDRKEGSSERIQFLEATTGKDESQMKSYWSRLIFTGKGVPPQVVETDAEVKELVSRNPDIIGYIDAAAVDDSVKVIATF
ncbi:MULTISPECIES: phosphate ABC transporter substrate-binding protein [unclassified Ketobacter]|jgi:ABC-type phosphate transport system substrate-binding protein|uniref:phosphate ABC transporter substrate-binding protein n=1 Tax=unclassified Ketobacter TaxID=2639109 RepID=UPI0025C4E08F|nr:MULTISPECIES: phosphate ABC transporter substrate-binding protein [unclassified Ketobacter]MEC8811121.1 phosphate ABC transporter substrate-binding protein [Pseudomonadota bacterium]